jgi:hypothetical protein
MLTKKKITYSQGHIPFLNNQYKRLPVFHEEPGWRRGGRQRLKSGKKKSPQFDNSPSIREARKKCQAPGFVLLSPYGMGVSGSGFAKCPKRCYF